MTKIRKSPAQALWDSLDQYLAEDGYRRFALDSHRNWDDSTRRVWRAVIFTETGKIIAKETSEKREDALKGVLEKVGRNVSL